MALKVLPKTQREANRYVYFQTSEAYDFKTFSNAFSTQFVELFGQFGMAKANIQVVKDLFDTQAGVIKTNAAGVDATKTTLLFMQAKSIKTTGTLKKLPIQTGRKKK